MSFTLTGSYTADFIIVYRPPPSAKHRIKTSEFISEMQAFLAHFTSKSCNFYVFGDFNLHIQLGNTDADASHFSNVLSSLGLVQHVTQPTHRSGNTLDLVITKDTDSHLQVLSVTDDCVSDHFTVCCKLALNCKASIASAQARKIKKMSSIIVQLLVL